MTRAQVQDHARRIAGGLGVELELDAQLAPLLSMRVGGPAAALLRPKDADQAAQLTRELERAGVPTRFLGGGSNLIASEEGLDFAVVHVAASQAGGEWTGPRARVPAGMPLAGLVREAMKRGLSGLEWAAGLPGSVGGAVVGNAGAFGGEMAALVRELLVLGPDGKVRKQEVSAEDFSYRSSFLHPDELVLEVLLVFKEADTEEVRRQTNDVNRRRAGSQPKGGHSSGCVFKNPSGDSAGRLIDSCGLKGRSRGGAHVSEAHANFIINEGDATAADLLGLIDEVHDEVLKAKGIDLELELRVWRGDGEGRS